MVVEVAGERIVVEVAVGETVAAEVVVGETVVVDQAVDLAVDLVVDLTVDPTAGLAGDSAAADRTDVGLVGVELAVGVAGKRAAVDLDPIEP